MSHSFQCFSVVSCLATNKQIIMKDNFIHRQISIGVLIRPLHKMLGFLARFSTRGNDPFMDFVKFQFSVAICVEGFREVLSLASDPLGTLVLTVLTQEFLD